MKVFVAVLVCLGVLALPSSSARADGPIIGIDVPSVEDEVFATPTPTFSGPRGTAADDLAAVTVEISSLSSAVSQTFTATGDGGTWTATPAALTDGHWRLYVRQRKQDGQESGASIDFWIDTVGPQPTVSQPDTWTNDTTPVLSGTAGTLIGDQPTVIVELGDLSAEVPVVNGGWEVGVDTPLPEGTHTVKVTQTDDAGHAGAHERVLKVDLTSPTPTILTGALTNDARPVLAGGAGNAEGDELSVTVELFGGTAATGTRLTSTTGAVQAGTWTARAGGRNPLADGIYTARVTQADAAGNRSSGTHTFTIDATKPAVTITSPVDYASVSRQPLVFGGTAGVAPGDAATVEVAISGPTDLTLSAPVAGGRWSISPAVVLASGSYVVHATQRDAAGNIGGSITSARRFTIEKDAEAPGIKLPSKLKRHRTSVTGRIVLDEAAKVTVRIQLSRRTVVTMTRSLPEGASIVRLKPSRTAFAKLRRKGAKLSLAVSAKDAAGNTGRESRVVKLVR